MKENFVPYELAVKLKEKGFNEDCYTVYNTATMRIERSLTTWKDYKGVILAPTISQVLKWLREENNVFILIEPDLKSPSYELVFSVRVKFYIKGEEDEGFSTKYLTYRRKSYELAALSGISYVIDNLI